MALQTIDTLSVVKRLRDAGMSKKVAEAQAEVLLDLIDSNLATKTGIAAIKKDIKSLEKDMKAMETNLKRDIKELELRMVLKLGTLMVVGIGVIAAMKLV